jgi:adenylosuccinate synthase
MSVLAVLGAHWGDEGKGKVTAALSRGAEACARFQGGPNAGHTIHLTGGGSFVLRMVPSGVLTGARGVIGGGCVINPRMLLDEVAKLRAHDPGVVDRLLISERAHVITSAHREQDRAGSGVGSTRMGVGPTYGDKIARRGIRIRDLITRPGELPAELASLATEFADELGGLCGDDTTYLRSVLDAGGTVVAEGAQGARLDVDHGDYPYVTSSNTTVGAVLTGLGLGPRDISAVLLVTPAYVTKVGGGSLPSQVDDALNAELQRRGAEIDGATNLLRDIGWLDVGWLRTACRLNQADGLIVTKVDVLAGLPSVGLYDSDATPAVEQLPGWHVNEVSARDESANLGAFLRRIESAVGCAVVAVSDGPGLDDWWWRDGDRAWLATPRSDERDWCVR